MSNILILAKKLISKIKKHRFLAVVLFLIIINCLVINTQNIEASYGLNTNIKQVKTVNSSTVYYLDHKKGVKKAYVNARAFLAYGNKWSDIKVINEKELNKWPEVKFVKSNKSSAVYSINNGQKSLIKSEQQFIDLGYKWSDVVTIAQADLNEYKIVDFKVAGAVDNNSENQLLISLDSSSPKADFLAINTRDNLIAVFNLKTSDKPIEIRNLVLNLKGLFNTDLIKEVYLTDENDAQYPGSYSLQNRQVFFHFNSKPLVVSSGETRKVKVYINFNDSSSDVTNNTIQIAINQAENIDGIKVVGAFPLLSETFKLVSGGNFLGKVVASKQSFNISKNEAIVGSTEKNVGKFNFAEISGVEDIFIKELKFVNSGDARADSLNNFKLKNKDGQIVATAEKLINDNELIFKLNNYKIKKGSSETFTILTNVIDGEKSKINFYLNKTKIANSSGSFNLQPNITNLDEIITIKREAIGAVVKELKVNNKVFTKQTGVIIGNFEIRNSNQKIKLERLGFSLEKSDITSNLTKDVYLVNYNSGEVYGNFSGDNFNNGIVNVNLNGLALSAKENLIIALITKIDNSAINGNYYKTILNNIDYRAENNNYYSDIVNIASNKVVVNKSNLYLYPNREIADQAFIKGEKNKKIASFIVEASAGGDAKITGLTFSRGDSSGAILFANGFSNLYALINSTKTNIIKAPYSSDLIFDGFGYVLKSGTRAEINVYADTEADLKASEIQLKISDLIAVNDNTSLPSVVNNLNINSFKVSFGEVKAEISKVADGFVAKGEDDNIIAGFKVKNSGVEDIRLQSVIVNADDSELTYSLGYSNLRVVDRNKQNNVGSTISMPVAGANMINLGNYTVKAGEEIIFDVHIKTNNNIADKNITIYFSDFVAQGYPSRINVAISGNPTDSFKFIPVVSSSSVVNNKVENFIKPVIGIITYYFHDANYPYKNSFEHTGVDIAVDQGTKVKTVASGVISEVVNGIGDQASYVTIKHSNILSTRYAHLSQINVKVGDKVKQGDIIGLSGGQPGTSGAGKYTNGPHLHFEVLENNIQVDPMKYL
ncbi:MAG: M23 family metallopeptidase [Patescibacteria group bacterium]